MRTFLALLLLLMGTVLAPCAFAQDFSMCDTNSVTGAWCMDEPKAYAAALAAINSIVGQNQHVCGPKKTGPVFAGGINYYRVQYQVQSNSYTCDQTIMVASRYRDWPDSGSCQDGFGIDPFKPTECLNQNKCLARNADLSPAPRVSSASSVCTGGCEYKIVESCGTTRVNGGNAMHCGVWEYSGNPCGSLPPPGPGEGPGDPPAPQKCTPAGDGQTFCLKPDGNHCASASTGRQICWRPGETGEKDDGPIKQKRDAGNDPIPPNLQLPSGDSLSPVGQPVRAVTNVNNQTINTVTQNYQTTHGTNAGGSAPNKGESASGDGSGKDEGEGSASGGGDCKTPPITSGDPVLGMVATQAWHTRCAVEAGNAAKVTGDVADCKQPFTVEGTNANAIKLRAMRAQLCNGDKNGNGRPDWTETNGTETPEPGEGEEEPGVLSKFINTDALDGGGFLGGSGSCPAMGTVDLHFVQVDLSNASWWCPFVSMCRAILLLMGAYIAIRLLME